MKPKTIAINNINNRITSKKSGISMSYLDSTIHGDKIAKVVKNTKNKFDNPASLTAAVSPNSKAPKEPNSSRNNINKNIKYSNFNFLIYFFLIYLPPVFLNPLHLQDNYIIFKTIFLHLQNKKSTH